MDVKFNKKIGSYMLQKLIGSGSFAKVYKGVDTRTSEPVAIKMISKDNLDSSKLATIEKEISILRLLQDPHIVQIKDIKKTQKNIYLILEFCHLGDLDSYIEKYYYDRALKLYHVPENVVRKILDQLFSGLRKMRENDIVHRDLKLANILVTKEFAVKIADFGFAKFQMNNQILMESYCGTPITMAPEILRKSAYNEKCDIWSLGVIIYKMLVGRYPFFPQGGGGLEELLAEIEKKSVVFPSNITISEEMKEMVRRMLEKDVKKRIGFEELFARSWLAEKKKEEGLDLKDALFSVYEKSMAIKKKQSEEKKNEGQDQKKIQEEAKQDKMEANIAKDNEACKTTETKLQEFKQEFEEALKLKDCESNNLDEEKRLKAFETESKEKCLAGQNPKPVSKDAKPHKNDADKPEEKTVSNENIQKFVTNIKQGNEEANSKPQEKTPKSCFQRIFADRLSSLQSQISEIKALSSAFLSQDSELPRLFGFLLLLKLAKILKHALNLEIVLSCNGSRQTFKSDQLYEDFQPSFSSLKNRFVSYYREINDRQEEFSSLFQEAWQDLLETVFFSICEQNLVNEYLLDSSALHARYQELLQIAGFLSQEQFGQTSFEFKETGDGDFELISEEPARANDEICNLERLLRSRLKYFQEIQ